MAVIATTEGPQGNFLLAALPAECMDRWSTALEPVDLPMGRVLNEPGRPMSHVFFPIDAIVSMLFVLESGATAEVALAGREGMVGVSLFMGGGANLSRLVVQRSGAFYRLDAHALLTEFERGGPTAALLLRYAQALMTQVSQNAACNRHHSVDQRLCRWLLLNLDRLSVNDLSLTQEFIAGILGVRREGVTESALKLQAAGLIRYARGHIHVTDRAGLEARACECYDVVRHEYERLLPPSGLELALREGPRHA